MRCMGRSCIEQLSKRVQPYGAVLKRAGRIGAQKQQREHDQAQGKNAKANHHQRVSGAMGV